MSGDERKTVTLTFLRSELLYDCKNLAFVEADVMQVQDEHARHQVFDIGEEGNVDRVTRVLNLAFAHCVELCYPYSKVPVSSGDLDDTLVSDEDYVLELSLPSSFSQTTVEYLRHLIHELLVYRVMYDWMSITKPESKENWQEKIENAEHEVLAILNARVGRVRRPMTPF